MSIARSTPLRYAVIFREPLLCVISREARPRHIPTLPRADPRVFDERIFQNEGGGSMTICHLVLDGNRATPIKPTRCFDGCAFQPVRGVLHPLHRYIGSSMLRLKPTRRPWTPLDLMALVNAMWPLPQRPGRSATYHLVRSRVPLLPLCHPR